MSSPEPARVEDIGDDPHDFITGASRDTINPTEGGTTKDGKVAVYGPSNAVRPADEPAEQ